MRKLGEIENLGKEDHIFWQDVLLFAYLFFVAEDSLSLFLVTLTLNIFNLTLGLMKSLLKI